MSSYLLIIRLISCDSTCLAMFWRHCGATSCAKHFTVQNTLQRPKFMVARQVERAVAKVAWIKFTFLATYLPTILAVAGYVTLWYCFVWLVLFYFLGFNWLRRISCNKPWSCFEGRPQWPCRSRRYAAVVSTLNDKKCSLNNAHRLASTARRAMRDYPGVIAKMRIVLDCESRNLQLKGSSRSA